ncbi:hypothetical protein ENSA5_41660 [Enhygromyxa salina]|uniref:Uncharacterized protein n=2 Tax=Enhygromyxa salina TaxID=215803 RepID=A0A2S9XME6_9BACT|nr:hypothetical protein ENSA5_41660 [Enhygromyxa salina]
MDPDSAAPLVLVLGRPGDGVAKAVAERLRGSFEVVATVVESASELRAVVGRYRERLGALVVGASDSSSASTLVWELDRGIDWLRERTLVVVDELAKLDSVPRRLLDAMAYLATDEDELDAIVAYVEAILERPREVDVLATLVRSAVDRRSVDSLPPLLGDWSDVERLDPSHLELAHIGDRGLRPNPLWAQWTGERERAAIEQLGARLGDHARPARPTTVRQPKPPLESQPVERPPEAARAKSSGKKSKK